jgi:hypothetical protein
VPDRITLSRTKGWKMPPNTVVVARGPGRIFGNPFTVADARDAGYRGSDTDLQAMCVDSFRRWLKLGLDCAWMGPESDAARAAMLSGLPELRGKNLACWCQPGTPCHADVLIELANGGAG